jgi:hypothetical protein
MIALPEGMKNRNAVGLIKDDAGAVLPLLLASPHRRSARKEQMTHDH